MITWSLTSCGATSKDTVLKSTALNASIQGMIQNRPKQISKHSQHSDLAITAPGPFASPSSTLPSLNITARWYSGITYQMEIKRRIKVNKLIS